MKRGGKGKEFEAVIHDCFENVKDVSVTRLKDDTFRYKGAKNSCDFIVYHKPYLYAIECKSVLHGNTLSFTNITEGQWDGLKEMSSVKGVFAGIICWWVDKDVTKYIPIQMLLAMREEGKKSLSWKQVFFATDKHLYVSTEIIGKKKRVYYDYDMQSFLDEMEGD